VARGISEIEIRLPSPPSTRNQQQHAIINAFRNTIQNVLDQVSGRNWRSIASSVSSVAIAAHVNFFQG